MSATIHRSLTIVTVDGFEPERVIAAADDGSEIDVTSQVVDPVGSANWLCTQFGENYDDEAKDGILWSDYDCGAPWRFSVLLNTHEVAAFVAAAAAAGYTVVETEDVGEPQSYGDGVNGLKTIESHPAGGWTVL